MSKECVCKTSEIEREGEGKGETEKEKCKYTWSPYNRRHCGAFKPKMLLGIFIFIFIAQTHTHTHSSRSEAKIILLCVSQFVDSSVGRYTQYCLWENAAYTQSVYEFNVTPWSHRDHRFTKAYFCIFQFVVVGAFWSFCSLLQRDAQNPVRNKWNLCTNSIGFGIYYYYTIYVFVSRHRKTETQNDYRARPLSRVRRHSANVKINWQRNEQRGTWCTIVTYLCQPRHVTCVCVCAAAIRAMRSLAKL